MNENVLAKLKVLAESAKYDVVGLCAVTNQAHWETP